MTQRHGFPWVVDCRSWPIRWDPWRISPTGPKGRGDGASNVLLASIVTTWILPIEVSSSFFAEKGTGRKMESVNAQHILVDSGLFFTWFIQSVSLSDLISLNNFKITNYIFQFEFSRSSPRTYNLPGEKETKRYVLLRTGIQRWEQSVSSPAGQNRRCHCFFFRMRQPSQILS